jgi:hypothetical protein
VRTVSSTAEDLIMKCPLDRPPRRRALILFACFVLATAGCSKPSQDAAPAPGTPPAAAQPAAESAAAPAAGAGQSGTPVASDTQPAAGAAADRPAAAAPEPPPPPPPRTFTLAEGTVLTIATRTALSTDRNAPGDRFEATLTEPIVEGDWVVAREGAAVEGLVVASSKGGRVKGTAELQVAVTSLTLSDGQRITLETAMAKTAAKSEAKKDVGKVAITTGAGALIGGIAGGGKGAAVGAAIGGAGGTAVVLGTRGKAAEIPAGSRLQFQVKRSVAITERK